MAINPLQRPMFANNQPMAPSPNSWTANVPANVVSPDQNMMAAMNQGAEGTGITSGLTPPTDDVTGAMSQVAQGFDQMNTEIDSAEDYEGIMNALRGDERSTEERRDELAQHVGEKDANQTPDSVLTLVQPLFEAMTVAEQAQGPGMTGSLNETQGMEGDGIATLPLLGADIGNNVSDVTETETIVQAPGIDEASMRIAMGEQPVNRYQGTNFLGENWQGNRVPGKEVVLPSVNYEMLGDELPKYRMMDLSQIGPGAEHYTNTMQELLKSGKFGGAPLTVEKEIANRKKMLEPYLIPPTTFQEEKNKLAGIFGSGDKTNAEIQALLALAQYGSEIAQSPGDLLTAVTTPAGKFAANLAEVAADKAASEKALNMEAYNVSEARKTGINQQEFNIVNDAINANINATNDFENFMRGVYSTALKEGINEQVLNLGIVNDRATRLWAQNNSHRQNPSETFMKWNETAKTWDLAVGRKTGDVNKPYVLYRDKNNDGLIEEIPMEDGWIPYEAGKIAESPGVADYSGSKKTSLLIPDNDPMNEYGYEEVQGFFHPGSGQYYISEGATYAEDGSLTKAGATYPAPAGFIEGNMANYVETKELQDGRIINTIRLGPDAGTSYVAGVKVLAPVYNDNGEIVGEEIRQMDFGGTQTPFKLVPAEWRENDNGTFTLVSGTPGIRDTGATHQMSFDERTAEDRSIIVKRAEALQSALFTLEESLLPYVQEVMGPKAGWDHFLFNRVGGWIPDSMEGFNDWLNSDKNAKHRKSFELFAREISRAFALSERYATTEQTWNRQIADDPKQIFTTLTNPEASFARLAEISRNMHNELEFLRSQMETDGINERTIKRMQHMPSGSKSDPYIYESLGHVEHLQKYINNVNNSTKKRLFLQFMPETLKALDTRTHGQGNEKWRDWWDTDDEFVLMSIDNFNK